MKFDFMFPIFNTVKKKKTQFNIALQYYNTAIEKRVI